MERPEQQLQINLCKLLDAALPGDCVYFAVPNGIASTGTRSKIQGGILKAMGVKAGVPDLVFVYQGRALFMEMKAPKGSLSADQRLMCLKLKAAGAVVQTSRGIDQTLDHLRAFGIPLRIKDDTKLDQGEVNGHAIHSN